jgi:hypothetical protein
VELGLSSAASALQQEGCAFVAGSAFLTDAAAAADFERFALAWNDLPPDPYIVDRAPYRFRRHAAAVLNPRTAELEHLPAGEYLQSATDNPLFGGVPRRFAPVCWDVPARRFCTALVRASSAEVLRLDGPVLVNIHLVRIVGGHDMAGEPAPEGPHRDGFDFVSVHLVGRDVDRGGETSVTDAAGRTRAVGTLNGSLDAVYVDDRELLHYTSPISADGRNAYRDVLLLSYEAAS